LTRECAELELKAYQELTVPQEQSALEQELVQAQDELERAKRKRAAARERFKKIKSLSTGSVSDLRLELRFEAGSLVAELEVERAGLALEQAKSRLKVLNEYEKPKRTSDLKAAIYMARSNELGARVELGLVQESLSRSRKRIERTKLSAREKTVIALVDQACSIDGTVRGKLEQFERTGKADATLQKEITESTNQLEAVINRAESERAAALIDVLKKAMR
jgi:hypothetical protein